MDTRNEPNAPFYVEYVKGSLLYKAVMYFYGFYRYSCLHKCMSTLSCWHKSSWLHSWLERYVKTGPTHPYSRTYRMLEFSGRKADSGMQLLHDAIDQAANTSVIDNLRRALLSEAAMNLHRLLIVFLAGFAGGYALLVTIRGMWEMHKLLYIVAAAILCCILALVGNRWRQWLEHSLLNRLYQYILK